MAINFPNSPTLDQTFSSGNNTYIWNGNAWVGYSTVTSSGGTVVSSQWGTVATGIHTLSNVGIGTTNATSRLTVKGNTSLETLSVSGVSTFSGNSNFSGTSNFATANAETINVNTGGMNVADGIPIYFGNAAQGYISYGSGLFQIRGPGGTTPLILGAGPTAGANVRITSGDGNYNYAVFSGTGVTVTGTTFTNQLSVSGVSTFRGSNNTNVHLGNTGYYSGITWSGSGGVYNGTEPSILTNSSLGLDISGGLGHLVLAAPTSSGDVTIKAGNFSPTSINCVGNAQVELYNNGDKKLETLGVGATTYGIHYASTFVGDGSGLTNIVATGSGVEIRDNGTIVGTASTIDFGDNLNVSAISAGVVTVTGAATGVTSQWITVATGIHTLSNVGIGTTNATSPLTVRGNSSFTGTATINGVTNTTQLNVTGVATFGGSSSGIVDIKNNISQRTYISPGQIQFNDIGGIQQIGSTQYYRASYTGSSDSVYYFSNYYGGFDHKVFYVDAQGATELYFDESKKLETTNTGITVTGTTVTSGLTVSGSSTFTGRINSGHINAVGVVTATSFVGDGSGLTGVTATGTGIVIKDDDVTVGTAATINFGSNLSVSTISAGVCTVSYTNPNSGVGTFAASVGVTTTIHTISSSVKTAEYLLFFEYNSNIQSQKILVMNNGTTAYSQEYAIMFEPNQIVSVGATVSGSNVLLQVTPKSGISGVTTFRYTAQTLG